MAETKAVQYDITVIGGGPGGYVAAIAAAQQGKKVCLIEKEYLGGVCLNVGCIPTKALIRSANVLRTVQAAAAFGVMGVDTAALKADMKQIQARKNRVVRQLTGGVRALMAKNGITVVMGTAVFSDPNTVLVEGQSITSRHFILATGSRSFTPRSISVAENAGVMTSTEALSLDQVPGALGIVGGGVIGIEFAYLYRALGAEVHVFEAMEQILPMVDEELSAMARKQLEQQGIVFHTGVSVTAVERDAIVYRAGGETLRQTVTHTLMAVGRTPNSDHLGLETLGIETQRGAVVTDEFLRTSVANIYAIGDVNAHLMLAHTASREGHLAVEHICTGRAEPLRYDAIPSCIYMTPELAAIGLTEQQAREKNLSVKVGSFPLAANGKALVEGESAGVVKVIVDSATGELYGAHMMGLHATELISELSLGMHLEATAETIATTVHPHPAVSESIPEAFLAAMGKAIHI